MSSAPLRAHEVKFRESRQEYQTYLPLIERIQADLKDDADELGSQEGWDLATQRGASAWVEDTDNIYRFLRRNGFNESKTYPIILNALSNRVTHNLHQPIPSIPPYSASPLFYILPLPRYTDRLGRPIAIISPREVVRDENGSLEPLTQWLWLASEMLRRTITDYWGMKRWNGETKGQGGEGCVVIVDAGGAGLRNIEVDLLPTLANVGSKNFPGLVEAAYVVNAGWTQRRLWGIVKKVLPRTALEKIKFIDDPSQLAEYFDLDKIPHYLGGRDPFVFAPHNPILEYSQSHAIRTSPALDTGTSAIPRAASFASAADVFYTAANTPAITPFASRHPSMDANLSSLGDKLRMTRATPVGTPMPDANLQDIYPSPVSPVELPFEEQFSITPSSSPLQVSSESWTSGSMTPLQRIRSLADFKLYLSPSRLAQVELLADSDDENPRSPVSPDTAIALPRRVLRPAMLDPTFCSRAETLASRRARPPLRLLAVPGHVHDEESVRTYSDRIASHHARGLQKLDGASPVKLPEKVTSRLDHKVTATLTPVTSAKAQSSEVIPLQQTQPDPLLSRPVNEPAGSQAISAHSRSSNPWYGYPAIRLPDPTHPGSMSIQPRYPRRRKRDLIKTLLFLFLIRLQSWRDTFERALGLNRLYPWVGFSHKWKEAKYPTEGLIQEAEYERHLKGQEKRVVRKGWEGDWAWMIVGFMLMRGTWTRLLAIPLEAMGLEGIRDILGLGI